MHIVILYSGGLDSLIMKKYAEVRHPEDKVDLVWYDIGQEYRDKELDALPEGCEVRTIDWLNDFVLPVAKENTQDIMIPGRNLALATLAACQYLPDEIWMGALLGETHAEATDKNWQFLQLLNDTLAYVLKPFGKMPIVRFPLAEDGFSKLDAVKWFLANGGTETEILHSSSCLTYTRHGDPKACGQCIVCLRRWGIFSQLGIAEEYVKDPVYDMSEQNKKMVCEMLKGEMGQECHYDEHRRREIIPALKALSVI